MGSTNPWPKTSRALVNQLAYPSPAARKKDKGALLVIGGSRLFHGAVIWPVKIASRIVDLVFLASIPKVLSTAQKALLADFIPIRPDEMNAYATQADTILIGPGLMRSPSTRKLTKKILKKYPDKLTVIDAGSLQMMDRSWLRPNHLITPNIEECRTLFSLTEKEQEAISHQDLTRTPALIQRLSKTFGGTIVLKGKTDIIAAPDKLLINQTGHVGMTKGGTGDVLAGLIAALGCQNPPFLAAAAGTYLNGKAGEDLAKTRDRYFNASDLCDQIPLSWKRLQKQK